MELTKHISAEEYLDMLSTRKRKSKFNAVKTKNGDGTVSDSKREARFDAQIMALRLDPSTKRVTRKDRFPLVVNSVLIGVYECDWVRELKTGQIEVYDAKGFKTREYIKKKSLMHSIYGVEIIEL
jgi:hypothetical protein